MDTSHSRRRMLGLLGMAAAGVTATACGQGGDSGGALRMLTYDDATESALLRTQLDEFSRQTGIAVRLDTLPGSGAAVYPDKLRTELLGGGGPDVFKIWGGEIGGPFTRAGQVAPLDAYVERYGWRRTVDPNAIAGQTYDGVTYGLPLWNSALFGWYDSAAFAEAGVTVPRTYTELEEVNTALVRAGIVPLGTAGKFGWHLMRLFEYLLESTAGPELHDALLTGRASWTAPQVVEAFRRFASWQERGWLPYGVLGVEPSVAEPGFVRGEHAYTISGAWVEVSYIAKSDQGDPVDIPDSRPSKDGFSGCRRDHGDRTPR
jgi:raffinose/stachyose/melibiose transport system substrate-binding protein